MVLDRHDWCDECRSKRISLGFSNGEQVGFTLDNTNAWQTIELEGIGNDIKSNYVNISTITSYTDKEVGFAEIKVFGWYAGMGYNDITKHDRFGNFCRAFDMIISNLRSSLERQTFYESVL